MQQTSYTTAMAEKDLHSIDDIEVLGEKCFFLENCWPLKTTDCKYWTALTLFQFIMTPRMVRTNGGEGGEGKFKKKKGENSK